MFVCQPVRAEQFRHLGHAFLRVQAQVGIDDLHLFAVQFDGDPECAARFQVRFAGESRQRTGLDQTLRQMREDGVAVAFFLDVQGRVEVKFHFQIARDQMRLVHALGARASDIQFLQCHHIRSCAGDHAGDAFGIELAVHADAAVHVVGHDA